MLTGDNEPFVKVEGESADEPSFRVLLQAQRRNSGNDIGANNSTATVNHLAKCEKNVKAAQREIKLLHKQVPVQKKYIHSLEN